jgi:transposase
MDAAHKPATEEEETNGMNYVGIDIGKNRCAACVADEKGEILRELTYVNTRKGIGELAGTLAGYGECSAVLESTGNMWVKTYEVLEAHDVRVKLANPLQTKAIAKARIKTDKLSARILAHLLRADLIPECYIPPAETRERRSLIRHRSALLRDRTRIRNEVHSLLDKYDLRCEQKDLFSVAGMRWLEGLRLLGVDQAILESHIRRLRGLELEVDGFDARIAASASADEDVRLLMTITGMSHTGALLIVSEIGDITRFESPKKLVSWAGLCPGLHQSGESVHYGGIKRDGNKHVRWLMVEVALSASSHDPEMRRLYERTRRRHGGQNAVVRVANKLLGIVWVMLTRRVPYRNGREALYEGKLKRMERLASSVLA